jgi:predicted transcriptional regulator
VAEFRFAGFRNPTYTQVPDEIIDVLMPELSDSELRVLLYIVRRTFGFKKAADSISLSQMVNGIETRDGRVLDRGTGLSRSSVQRAVNGLRQKGVIVSERQQDDEHGNVANIYRLRMVEE